MKVFNTLAQLQLAQVLTGTPVRVLNPALIDGIVVESTGDFLSEGFALQSGNVFVPRMDDQEVLTGRKSTVGVLGSTIAQFSKDSAGVWQLDTSGKTSTFFYAGQLWWPDNEVVDVFTVIAINAPIGDRIEVQVRDTSGALSYQSFSRFSGLSQELPNQQLPIVQPVQLGDGVKTTFISPHADSSPATSFLVTVDGIMQIPTESYTTAPGQISFSEAPPVDAQVSVTFYRPVAPGELPGTDVSEAVIVATGTTAPRTAAARFGDTVNVSDFGAVGDGVTDDTAAIQAAIDSVESTGGKVQFPQKTFKITSTLHIRESNIHVDFNHANLLVEAGFSGTEVLRLGFKSGGTYIVDGSLENLYVTFTTTAIIETINAQYIARFVFRDFLISECSGGLFTSTSIGHEISCTNMTLRSNDTWNTTGVYVNFTDSYFADLKPIAFTEFGIINAGADNRYYGCHAWSQAASNPSYNNSTTKILYYDVEDGMWTDCYADTFGRKDDTQPPSYANGGIAFAFNKSSGIGRMVNCGFYAVDTDVDSLIGVWVASDNQQLNIVNGYVLGSNSDAYLAFVSSQSTGTAVNLIGCNFGKTEYQAKELYSESSIASETEFYIKSRTGAEHTTLRDALRSWKPHRLDHGLISFRDDTVSQKMYMWDRHQNDLVKVQTANDLITSWGQIGILDADGTDPVAFFGKVVDQLTARGLFPCKFMIKHHSSLYPNITANVMPYPCIYEGQAWDVNTFSMQAHKYAASGLETAAYEDYGPNFHTWAAS